MERYIKWFGETGLEDVAEVGGKNASLGEMYRNLKAQGIAVPNGFAVTAAAYMDIFDANAVWDGLHSALDGVDYDDVASLQKSGELCRSIVLNCKIPETIKEEILEAYAKLVDEYGEDLTLAVRSSATAEDSPEASFAGQNESYLNIKGEEALLSAYLDCLASNFTDRSLHYKYDNGFDPFRVQLAVTIMKMVRSDIGSSGVMFTMDTETGFRDVVFINAAYGLGENIVQGTIDPDIFYVHKPTFKKGSRAVLKRKLGAKHLKMIISKDQNNSTGGYTENIQVNAEERKKFCIDDDDVLTLADYAIKIEAHYSAKAGAEKPMDIEWAKDGLDGRIYIVQARPETVESRRESTMLEQYRITECGEKILCGHAVGSRIGSGRIRRIRNRKDLSAFVPGEVLVAETTSPDWEPVMKLASAVVTERGGRTCHAAIVSRELGIPAIVGAEGASEKLVNGMEVTVSCAEGEIGCVYAGKCSFETLRTDLSRLPVPETEIMMNLGNPNLAFSLADLPVAGIGLARMEFIINEYIEAHPMALIHPERTDIPTRKAISDLTSAHSDPEEFFVTTLSEGVATLASCVYPRPCVVRMSDFKSNEYASLLGGRFFEPAEENPMIGFRGASRYSHPAYEEGFALECRAMKRVREEMGFENVILMIPFCRRVEEAGRVIETMEKYGLKRGEHGLRIYMMCEIPNNVIMIDQFSEYFDGFSIGSNDLTQLTLGVDRDSEMVAFDYDERDEGVMRMIEMAVEGAKRNGAHSGICGQAPSDYPEMAEFLIKLGIDSMSLNPDSVLETIRHAVEIEQGLKGATDTLQD